MGLDNFKTTSDAESESIDLDNLKTPKRSWDNEKVEVPDPISGILLGSAIIKTYEDQSASLIYETEHWDYLFYLKKQCPEVFSDSKIRKQEGGDYYIRSSDEYDMYSIYNKWYRKGKKELPNGYRFTPEKLMHWYITSGVLLDDRVHIYTNWMDDLYTGIMATILRSTIPNARIHREQNTELGKARFVFWHNAHYGLFDYIGSCPIRCCKSKWLYD